VDLRPIVQRQREFAVLERGDDPAHRLLGVVLHMPHVRRHHVAAMLLDRRPELQGALFVRGDLRPQVGEILIGLRDGCSPLASRRAGRFRAICRCSTSLKLSINTPSSAMLVENGGIDPGVVPPMSA
jgi:hypothetical protein